MVTLHKYTFLRTYLTKPLIITIPKRGMKIAKHILKTQLMPKSHSALGSTRGMAAYTYNHPEKTPNTLGAKNNGYVKKNYGKKAYLFRHKEFHRKRCPDPDCSNKVCNKPCGPIIDIKAVGNSTHNAKPKPDSTSVVLDPNKDINGNQAAQEAYIYQQAHSTTPTTEISHGTNFINQPHVIAEIKKYEDNS